jgi:hypothetical protein
MTHSITALVYLLVGLAIVYLFQSRRKMVSHFTLDDFPGIDEEGFHELTLLLKTAYERMLYMGVAFFPLAYTSYINGAFVSKVFFLALILLLFISNIPPRNKIMRLLDRYEISMEELRERGIRL